MSKSSQTTTFLHPLSQKILERPPLTHGDFNNYCFGWTQDEKQEIKKVFNFLSEVTSKLFSDQGKQNLRQKAETEQCPDFFMVDYFFLRIVRDAFVNFHTIVYNPFINMQLFEGQGEKFEIIDKFSIEFFEWYIQFYPLEPGKHIFWKKDEKHVWIKFTGNFATKEHKLYVTVPDQAMYTYVRMSFFAKLQGLYYYRIGRTLQSKIEYFEKEIVRINASRQVYFSENLKKNLVVKTWLFLKNWDFSSLKNKIQNLIESGDEQKFSFKNLVLGDNSYETVKILDLMFTIYFIDFFLYSLVKDTPESFFDMFFTNYGFWTPHRHMFQDIAQKDIIAYYAKIYNYTYDLKDLHKWPFRGFRADNFFYWYHDFVYERNPYFQDLDYYSIVRKTYSKLVAATVDHQNLVFRGEDNGWYATQRFDFDCLTGTNHEWSEEHFGHPEFLKKFVKEREILLGYFTHMFKSSYWESRGVEPPEMPPFDLINLILRIKFQSWEIRFSAFTTDLELSQGFWEAVSEDKF